MCEPQKVKGIIWNQAMTHYDSVEIVEEASDMPCMGGAYGFGGPGFGFGGGCYGAPWTNCGNDYYDYQLALYYWSLHTNMILSCAGCNVPSVYGGRPCGGMFGECGYGYGGLGGPYGGSCCGGGFGGFGRGCCGGGCCGGCGGGMNSAPVSCMVPLSGVVPPCP